MYCSKCGAAMADGSSYCAQCGQAFTVPAAPLRPPVGAITASPSGIATATFPAYAASAAVPRVEYAGFWLRFLALLIDNVVIGFAFILILIPLIFLTGLNGFIGEIHPNDELSDAGVFTIIGLVVLVATCSLVLTWLYHALMESSEWQATLGKKVLGLVVTDMAGLRVSFGRSTGRHFAKIVTNLMPFLIGYIMAGFTDKKQALHDMFAGCLVLRRNG